LKITETDWRVGFDVTSDRQSAIQIVQSSIRIFSGVFQAVREFLEVRQPMWLVFASKRDLPQTRRHELGEDGI
jgi:hypothetical protein